MCEYLDLQNDDAHQALDSYDLAYKWGKNAHMMYEILKVSVNVSLHIFMSLFLQENGEMEVDHKEESEPDKGGGGDHHSDTSDGEDVKERKVEEKKEKKDETPKKSDKPSNKTPKKPQKAESDDDDVSDEGEEEDKGEPT